MTRTRVWLVSCTVIAAFVALIWVIMAYTPLRQLLPGTLRGDLRGQYMETALRIDSLEQRMRINDAYLTNIAAIMNDDLPSDSVMQAAADAIALSDSLLAATEAERRFVQNYRNEERFNLSVLAPLAAEGMIFTTPIGASATVSAATDGVGVDIATGRALPVTAVYRGTVIAISHTADTGYTIVVQHPNDFISVYSGLSDTFVARGQKVEAAQGLGQTSARGVVAFELWHNGTTLDPREYIAF